MDALLMLADSEELSANNNASASSDEEEQDDEVEEMVQHGDIPTYQSILEANSNSPALIIAMAYSLRYPATNKLLLSDFEKDDLFHGWNKTKKKLKPTVKMLLDEVERRKKILKISKKTNKQMKKKEYLEWLSESENISFLPDDHTFLMQKIVWLRQTLQDARQNEPETHLTFRGMNWILRLIHCLSSHDDCRLAYTGLYDSHSRSELGMDETILQLPA